MADLPPSPILSRGEATAVSSLRDDTAHDPPADLAARVLELLQIDLSTTFASRPIPHPFGKASGQLSCTAAQVEDDVMSGVAFIVLKTVIAEDPAGRRSMGAWATDVSHMRVERRTSMMGKAGWTVTWKGRGWPGGLDAYCDLYHRALEIRGPRPVPVIPSVKFHLPRDGEPFRVEEYRHTLDRLGETAKRHGEALAVEKDFSPTLAGDDLASLRPLILRWVREVPETIHDHAPGPVTLGVKMMNALFDEAFQVDMVRAVSEVPHVAYLTVFNRLFDRAAGVAYGGWDLSDRNLRVLERVHREALTPPELSGTGNICSGRMMVEYARRGCASGQIHTFFQVPRQEYTASGGRRAAAALHTLMLHPTEGLVPWVFHAARVGWIAPVGGTLRFRDLVGCGVD